jgi:glycosyltransferase involved in cell wall biosynthesis
MHIAINAIPIQPGGGLTVLCGLVQSLRACRPAWQITVLTGDDATHDAVRSLGCANNIHGACLGKRVARAFLWQSTRLGALLRKHGVDVLVGFNHYQLNVGCPQIVYHLNLRRFCRSYRSRQPAAALQEKVRDWLARRALRHADANVFESRFLRDAAAITSRRRPRNARIIYIGLPDQLLTMAAEPQATSVNPRRLVAITSPESHKDNPTLLRTLARLTHKEPQQAWHLDIIGGVQPAAWNSLRQLAEGLGVRHRISWHGFCNQETITQLLRGALCLVSTSQLESFAMVALEAMARGCPPVVADCTAMPESIGDAGLVAAPGRPSTFADAVLRIATEPGLREQLVARGCAWIRNFRWSRCGVAFAETIEKMMDDTATRGFKHARTDTAAA